MLDTARDRAIGLGYSTGWTVVKAMPRRVSERAFRAAADMATVRNGGGTRQLRKNLRRVVGPAMSELRMDALVGDALRSYSRYWLETFRLEAMDHAAVAASFEQHMTGKEHIDAGLARGKGVVIALPHSGNWDASGVWLVHHNGPFTTVAERLRANRVVCLLADRDLSRNGIEVSFFGEPARMPAGPALLAAMTGATLHAVHSYFLDDGWGHSVSAPIELPGAHLREKVTIATQRLADYFAEGITRYPADWHMLQRLWLADLQPRGEH